MRLAIVVYVTGTLVRLFSPALLAPALVAFVYGEIAGCGRLHRDARRPPPSLGMTMRRAGGGDRESAFERLRRVEGLAIVAATWMAGRAHRRDSLHVVAAWVTSTRSSSRCPA